MLGLALVWDLAGGVVANSLDSAKRFYHRPLPAPSGALARCLHHPVGFAAAHVQPILVGLLFGGPWWWGLVWYAAALAGVLAVTGVRRLPEVPDRLQRPLAMGLVGTGVLAAPLLSAPEGFGWLPAVLLLKLVGAHAVPETAAVEPDSARPSA
ncbi:hypothetical protein [Streptomyces oceani]|uniref:hypothetical protein n=1 Tax=Streptomyces oceani TaxID=1075402 RepID=UPI001112FCFD|nr:hypothetical protein [Streptomyces oceani]